MSRSRSRIDLLIDARNLLHALSLDYREGRTAHFKTPGYSYRNRKPALVGFTLMKLATFAGCSKEDLYYHWQSKNVLLLDIAAQGCDDVEADLLHADSLLTVGVAAAKLVLMVPPALLDADAALPKAVRYRIDRCVGRIRARARACIVKQHGAQAVVFAEAIALMMAAACTATTCHQDRTAVIWQAVTLGADRLVGEHMTIAPSFGTRR